MTYVTTTQTFRKRLRVFEQNVTFLSFLQCNFAFPDRAFLGIKKLSQGLWVLATVN